MKSLYRVLTIVSTVMLMSSGSANAQDTSSLYNKILHFPDRLFKKVNDKTTDINNRLIRQSEKYLQRLAKTEDKLKKKLAKKDSLAAIRIFDGSKQQYAELQAKINNVLGKASKLPNKYIPHLDSLKTAFNFLSNVDGLDKLGELNKIDKLKKLEGLKSVDGKIKNVPDVQGRLNDAIGKMDGLQDKFNQAEEIKKFIQQRKQLLQEQLGKFGLLKELKAYQKQVYYYQAQVDEYKKMFDDPSKLEAKALELLKKSQTFRDFFAKNSQLASLFRLPGSSSGGSMVSLAGLQTRASVEQNMMERFGSIPDVKQLMQQHAPDPKQQLKALKDQINKTGSKGGEDKDMPDFKPNNQKTKTFKQRLEFGSNLQTVKSNRFFPSTTDIGLSLGYKLNDKSIIGIGGSYKMGWGKDIKHISITHQGLGVRSFLDYKIKGSFWLSGGAEMNYRSQFTDFEILDNYSAWQKSTLIGVSKKYQVSKKVKGDARIMYDALWKEQIPRSQPIIFRIGYGIR